MSGLQGQGLWDGTGKSEKDQLLELYGAVNAIMSAVQTLERTINVTVKTNPTTLAQNWTP
jgi:hypothetical protein